MAKRAPNMSVSVRHLRMFDHVARAQSLSAAAAQSLRLSQPALTQSISHLEAQLGVKLFERQSEGSFLTPAGAIFYRRTQRFFAQIKDALAVVCGESADGPQVQNIMRKLSRAHLRCLWAIRRQGSFRAAAQHMGVALASVQQSARMLELLIGIDLYRRSAAGLCLSETAVYLARRSALAEGEIQSALNEISATRAPLSAYALVFCH